MVISALPECERKQENIRACFHLEASLQSFSKILGSDVFINLASFEQDLLNQKNLFSHSLSTR